MTIAITLQHIFLTTPNENTDYVTYENQLAAALADIGIGFVGTGGGMMMLHYWDKIVLLVL